MSNMNRNEKIKRLMPLAMLLIAFLSLVAAIIVLVSAASADASYKKVLLRISAVLFFILMALALYYFYLTRESDPNFFLFDQTTRKNIPVDQLTFGIVNERMDFYLSLISDSDEELVYSLVGSNEADPLEGKISDQSPIGAALIDMRSGDEKDVETPAGIRHIHIIEVTRTQG